jgi:hypothetical protein
MAVGGQLIDDDNNKWMMAQDSRAHDGSMMGMHWPV